MAITKKISYLIKHQDEEEMISMGGFSFNADEDELEEAMNHLWKNVMKQILDEEEIDADKITSIKIDMS